MRHLNGVKKSEYWRNFEINHRTFTNLRYFNLQQTGQKYPIPNQYFIIFENKTYVALID